MRQFLQSVEVAGKSKQLFNISKLAGHQKLPVSTRVLLEAGLRTGIEDGEVDSILRNREGAEVPFTPSRVILQDFTGVPAVADLASMRDSVKDLGGDPTSVNPACPVDLVIDHSVIVDHIGPGSQAKNEQMEFDRNKERFSFLKWGSKAFDNLTIVPPGSGIVHQVNLEFLARVVFDNKDILYPDSLVGTDSHTTMINGLGVLGWGVGGLEAEAVMMGHAMQMVLPKVVGVNLTGKLQEGVTATDLVLTIVQLLRSHGVVGKFVEFHGEGLANLSLADRATIANMAPEYGATCGFFPVDEETVAYLRQTGRSEEHIARVEAYHKTSGTWGVQPDVEFTENVSLDMTTVEAAVSGPKRPQDLIHVKNLPKAFNDAVNNPKANFEGFGLPESDRKKSVVVNVEGEDVTLTHGSVCIAAITSCTNTSNPSVMLAAGLVAKKARDAGLKMPSFVKTSLSPGSGVVTSYLEKTGLQEPLNELGFSTTGYGCMTCIGNSGDIHPELQKAIVENNLVGTAVLSGNRNFEARVHPNLAGAYLASPPLVVAYALAGNCSIDFSTEPIGQGNDGKDVFLRDIWPTSEEVKSAWASAASPEMFVENYQTVLNGNDNWRGLDVPTGSMYDWSTPSTYIHKPPFTAGMPAEPTVPSTVEKAACLLYLGDSITTDHISPAGRIADDSPAARYLREMGATDLHTYGARRGNNNIMTRGTFANTKIGNKIIGEGQTGPTTIHHPTGDRLSIFEAAERYQSAGTPTVVLAGAEYGSGSSRDWAAKGTQQLGVRAVIAESYERIHRSNLAGMGVIPFCFAPGESAGSLGLTGKENFSYSLGSIDDMTPGQAVEITAEFEGKVTKFQAKMRLDTKVEIEYYRHGGILPYVVRKALE